MLFSLKQKVYSVDEIEEELFIPVDFSAALEKHFGNIRADDDHRAINGDNYSIEYFVDAKPKGNLMMNLYGEEALFNLIRISKIYDWQIFDTASGEMIDLEHPEKNGFEDFKKYLQKVISKSQDYS